MLNRTCFIFIVRMMSFSEHIPAFSQLILKSDPALISENEYCKSYFSHLQQHINYYLKIYSFVLGEAIVRSGKSKNKIALVDYGTGNGLLGIFAKFCGIGYVAGCDIDDDFVKSAEKLSSLVNIKWDKLICGNIDDLKNNMSLMNVDVVVGTDVIEHVYNPDYFFERVASLGKDVVGVFTTASNPGNPFKVSMLKKIQLKDEYEGAAPDDSLLYGGQSHESFFNMRKNIISSAFPEITGEELELLVKTTRGLNQMDIIAAVESYLKNNQLPQLPAHPTNTCNPYTGSWTERLLSLQEYQIICSKAGFDLSIVCGFYNDREAGMKSKLAGLLNILIKMLGMKIAPFIVLIAQKQKIRYES